MKKEHGTEDVEARIHDVTAEVRNRLKPVDQWVHTLVRERPLLALVGAVGIGFLIGHALRKL